MKISVIKYLSLLFLIAFLVSCNKKQQSEKREYRKWLNPDEKLDLLHLDLNAKINVDDEFKIYYTEDNTMGFNEDRTIRVKVIGDSLYQNITFNFPKNKKPTNLRIDLGFSKVQESIRLKSMSFVFKDRNFKITPTELLKYFVLNDGQLRWDLSTTSFIMKNLDADTYFPFIYSTDSIKQPLTELLDFEAN